MSDFLVRKEGTEVRPRLWGVVPRCSPDTLEGTVGDGVINPILILYVYGTHSVIKSYEPVPVNSREGRL